MTMDVTLVFTRLKSWGIQGGLSVLDQAVFSGANFILTILLARWVSPSEYGVFAVAFSIYLFAYQIHNALIIEPLSVLGPATMDHRLPDFLRDQIKVHFLFSIFAGLAIIVIGRLIFSFNQELGRVLFLLGVVLAFILLPLLIRRGFYLFRKPQLSLLGSITYALFLIGGIWFTQTSIRASVGLAFPLIGVAGLASGILLISRIPQQQSSYISFYDILHSNWKYGKWLVYSSLLIALAAQVQTFIVGALLGLSDAGVFRALQNFVQPMILFFAAVSAYLLPSLSFDFGKGNIVGLRRKGSYLLYLFIFISVCFEFLLLGYGHVLEEIVYGGKFSINVYLTPVWGLVPVAAGVTYVYYFLLQSIQRPSAILVGSIVWAITSAASAFILSSKWGILGATVSVILGYLFSGFTYAILYRYYISEEKL